MAGAGGKPSGCTSSGGTSTNARSADGTAD
nr:MAG TPA: hypothetical protein [Caudoviricetes sp.]